MKEAAGAARVRAVFDAVIALHETVRDSGPAALLEAARAVREAHGQGRKTLVFGNGGSAADAQHLAAELVGRFQRDRIAVAALALTTDTSILTAVGNDYGFDRIFARQVEALGQPGDVAIGISTSGASPNVVQGLQAARARGLTTVALTGRDGGDAGRVAGIHVNVPDASAARVQEVHRTLIHAICELVEMEL
ncbi:MAG TPA: SIS domain-containing protein [Vicinamibacterales bacterium]|nr:SIS domain-containing protein [Vicinamibacterales bacterium]